MIKAASLFPVALLALFAMPASAQEVVDLELVLAVDVSRSMDIEEQAIQRAGYSAAFRHRDVIAAITGGMHGRIAVAYVEWAGAGAENIVVPWTIIAGEADSLAFAAKLDGTGVNRYSGTSIASGLLLSAALIEGNKINGLRRVIDVSGDGPNNIGPPVEPTRDAIVGRGIAINGLPIMLRPGGGFFSIEQLDAYYEDCVIGGPAAFMIPVRAAEEFPEAIRRKLVLEIAGTEARVIFAAANTENRGKMDCLIGEKLRGRWYYGNDR